MNKQLKMYRKSGLPVDLTARAAFETEWRVFYDKAAARAKLDMLALQRYLRFGERQLVCKHNIQVTVDMPKSAKAWTALIQSYEDCPVMLARSADGAELVAVIMDEGLS